jgi:hypothetical protein
MLTTNTETTQMNYANHYGYSDVNPYEIVRRISDKTLEVREMKAERDPSWKPEVVPGGFSFVFLNQNSQKWIITSDESSKPVRIRLGKHGWKDSRGNRYALSDKPHKFYDYNF